LNAAFPYAPFVQRINVVSVSAFKNILCALHLSKSQKASNEKHNYNNTNDIKHIILLSFA